MWERTDVQLSGFAYNKAHQKPREATRDAQKVLGNRNFGQYPYLGINISFVSKRLEAVLSRALWSPCA